MRGHIAKKGKKYYIVVDFDKDDNGGKRNQKWLSGYERKKTLKTQCLIFFQK